MIAFSHFGGVLYLGYKMPELDWDQLNELFRQNFFLFLEHNGGFRTVYEAWKQKYFPEDEYPVITYFGHAAILQGQWVLRHGPERIIYVQDFIDEQDGKHPLILLLCCNPEDRFRVHSKKSLVIYSRDSMTLETMWSSESRQLIHIPGYGDFVGTTEKERLEEIAAAIRDSISV